METASPSLPRQENHILFLDQLRGLAIASVFGWHCLQATGFISAPTLIGGPWWKWGFFPFAVGGVGVAIFFVISGFCIHLSYARSKGGWRTFYIRRFFRIYPPYLVALLFFAFVFPPTRLAFRSYLDFIDIWLHLVLFQNIQGYSLYSINGAFWSLAVEIQLYLIYPLLLRLTRWLGWNGTLLLAGFFEVALRVLLTLHLPVSHLEERLLAVVIWGPLGFWFSWAIGARIADDWISNRPIFMSRFPLWLGFACFLACNLVSPLLNLSFTFGAVTTASFMAWMLSSPTHANRLIAFPLSEHLRKAGLISYSVYLLHEPFLMMIPQLLPSAYARSPLLVFFIGLMEWPFLLLVSWAFYRLLELPAIAWGKRIIQRSCGPASEQKQPAISPSS